MTSLQKTVIFRKLSTKRTMEEDTLLQYMRGEESFSQLLETQSSGQASSTAADPKRKHDGDGVSISSKRFKYDGNETTGRKIPEDLAASSSDEEEEEDRDDVTAHVNQFFAELHVDQSRQRKRLLEGATIKFPRRRNLLPTHLHSVMGNANLRLARGDTSAAIELCMEVIRQAPHSPEPYLTLATVYEEIGDKEKLLQVVLLTAHLKRNDISFWIKSGQLALEQHDPSLAVRCYSKASKLDIGNLSLLWQRASLHMQLGEQRRALEAFEQLLKALPPDSSQEYVEVTKEMARLHHGLQDTPRAIALLQGVLGTHRSHMDEEGINLLAELCSVTKRYQEVFSVITDYYNMVPIVPEDTEMPPAHVTPHGESHDLSATPSTPVPLTVALRMSIAGEEDLEHEEASTGPSTPVTWQPHLTIPEDIPVDLRTKLAVSLIHLGKPLPEELLQPVFSNPEDYGDLFLDIADAYMENGEHPKALPLLSALVHTEKYSQAGVWLKYADSLQVLNDLEGAAMAFSKVLALAPQHTETRLTLATLYVQLGNLDDALALLEAEPILSESDGASGTAEEGLGGGGESVVCVPKEHGVQDIRLLLHKYTLLMNDGRLREYVGVGEELLTFLFREVHHRSDVKALMHVSRRAWPRHQLQMDEGGEGEGEGVTREEVAEVRKGQKEQESLFTPQEWWRVFLQTCLGLLHLGHRPRTLHLIHCAQATRKFSTEQLEMGFIFFAASVYYLQKEFNMTFAFLKQIAFKKPDNKLIWNFINLLPTDTRLQKFVLRLCFKNPSNPYLMRVCANYSHGSSNYKFALSQYELAYRQMPHDYLLCLCIAIAYLNMACQVKQSVNKNTHVTQASAFLYKYTKLRGRCQETWYNLGRAFHQLGIVHMACQFYKQVLVMEPECRLLQWTRASDLRAEAAWNLSLIYRASGNRELAHSVLIKFCRI